LGRTALAFLLAIAFFAKRESFLFSAIEVLVTSGVFEG